MTHGAMFVPVILGSDKTTVSVATGNNEYWPVYGSIGNIHNNVRRAHGSGLVLIAFLSIPKSIYLFFKYIFQSFNNFSFSRQLTFSKSRLPSISTEALPHLTVNHTGFIMPW